MSAELLPEDVFPNLRRPVSWRARAACRGLDTALFFPVDGENVSSEAREVCAGCPVKVPCLDWALPQVELHGIWAGTSMRERRRLRRERGLTSKRRRG